MSEFVEPTAAALLYTVQAAHAAVRELGGLPNQMQSYHPAVL